MDSNLSDLSQSDNEFKLFCWVLNQSKTPFSVKIGTNETVDDLKKAIRDRELTGFNPTVLTLWKLSLPIPSSELNKLRYARTLKDIEDGSVELDPVNELSEYFSSPPPLRRHIHIIVQLPLNLIPTGSTEGLFPHALVAWPSLPLLHLINTEEIDTEERQFRLLCKKYWNRGEEGRGEIYTTRTVQVPFMARPGTEGAEGAATTSEGMVIDAEYLETGAQDAIPVASKTTSAPSGTSEGSNEVLDEELDLDFGNGINCAVPYESLSLGLDFRNFFDKGYSSILVRKEYRDMFQHISDLHKNRKRGVVVTGMPGIGKSIFLFFVLIERILNGQHTAYQHSPDRVILMLGRDDVRIFPANRRLDNQRFPGTWALVDSNVQLVQPRSEFTDTRSEFYLVQAAGPQPVRWKAWKKHLSAAIAVMKPWLWEELYIGGTEFISPPLEPLTLRNIYVKYGGSARHCYNLAQSCREVIKWEKGIPELLNGVPDIAIFEKHIAGNTIDLTAESVIKASSQLITIIPDQNREPRVTLVSRHIAKYFFRAILVKNHERFWDYFNQFSSVSESRTPAGWLWEIYAMTVLSSQRTQTTPINLCPLSPIKSSQPSTKKIRLNPIQLPFSRVRVHGDEKSLGEELSSAIPSLSPTKSTLFRLGAKNQVTFDAFSISGDNIVTLYQATIRESHSINAKGLDFVWDALKLAESQDIDVKELLPSPTRKWRLVFVIPEEAETHWKTPQGIDFGGIKPKRQWGKYVEQFTAVLQKRTITMADLISYDSG